VSRGRFLPAAPLTGGAASATIAPAMPRLGRAVLLLLVVGSLVAAGIPPALDEDRSVPGFCSPDCPLQQDAAHSVAVAPPPPRHESVVGATRERPPAVPVPRALSTPASADAPRAPPGA
jgi:hypothetical protein